MAAPLVVPYLVSVEQAREHCLRDSADTSQDTLWNLLIPAVSEAAALWADRQFAPEDNVERVFGGGDRIQFSPWELREITTVEDENGAELGGTLFPVSGSAQGTYWSVETTGNVGCTILGDWGMAETPPSVQLACLIALDSYYRNPSMHSSESLGGYSFVEVSSQWEIGGLPRASRALLDNFRRVHVT
jgi:hypothetical protein